MENINKVPISSYILKNIQRIVQDFKICYKATHQTGVSLQQTMLGQSDDPDW